MNQAEPLNLPEKSPRHIAIIMDGNGRWALSRGLPRLAGHRAGTENLRRVIEACVEFGVKYLTLYAFSTENWGRPVEEVRGLMRILGDVIDRELRKLHEEGVQLRHIGRLNRLKPSLKKKVLDAIELTKNNDRLTLNIAFNYGGRDEIARAMIRMAQAIEAGELVSGDISEQVIPDYLDTSGIPDPDLVIRTSGEERLSNFLTWQCAYSELLFMDVYWPDFSKSHFQAALDSYARRNRRFGGLAAKAAV